MELGYYMAQYCRYIMFNNMSTCYIINLNLFHNGLHSRKKVQIYNVAC